MRMTRRYQRCTEIIIPVEVAASNPMFLPCDAQDLPGNCWGGGADLAAYCSRAFPAAAPFTAASLQVGR